ncbi:hypothetical protein [Mesorhizobium sp. WSM3224]|uniref:hypothetical protein n=1 Tax=Mesorhizobium sp. WSM3224 TaxID=1040986 RepID=UPI0003FCC7E4|nr:hypothetical protein [Mesorhizobium sp. WSM3224]
MNDGKLGLTIDEAVARSGLGRTKIFENIKLGKLTARKAGRRTIILSDDLSAFLKALPVREAA